jgi:hypothetical protein
MPAESIRTLSLLTVCCFLSGSLFSQAGALEKGGNCCCGTISNAAFEELYEPMASPDDSRSDEACIGDEDFDRIRVMDADVVGWIALYNTFMFIYYGRQCLETLDPTPCRAMVNHLFLALFLGILFEAF